MENINMLVKFPHSIVKTVLYENDIADTYLHTTSINSQEGVKQTSHVTLYNCKSITHARISPEDFKSRFDPETRNCIIDNPSLVITCTFESHTVTIFASYVNIVLIYTDPLYGQNYFYMPYVHSATVGYDLCITCIPKGLPAGIYSEETKHWYIDIVKYMANFR